MKIGVVGPGAVGSYYGAKLWRDGHEVHFLMRSDYQIVRRRGVRIKSPEGGFVANPGLAQSPEKIGVCDLVIIALKTTANHLFPKLLPPLVGPNTAVLTLQNGLGSEEKLAELFGPERIMGGLCFVCLNRVEPGVIEHIAHGKIVMGEFGGYPEPRTHDIATAFKHAGIPVSVAENLACAHWEKLVWNIPFNGLGVASCSGLEAFFNLHEPKAPLQPRGPCLTTDLLLADPGWSGLVRELMLEIIAAARFKKFHLEEGLADEQIEKTRIMSAYKPSTLIDFERGQPLELDSLFLEPLRQARAADIETPRLQRLCAVLRALEETRERSAPPEIKQSAQP
ncbi:MAG TPA: 2-dehydropantoate 2-reductase [Verrucomicrobiae bacterium]|jgi:2-dehydropantoate 2-reductase